MNTIYHETEFGLAEIPKHPQYVITHKRDQAEELRAKARDERLRAQRILELADEYEHMAKRADSLADAWEGHNRIHAEAGQ